MNLVEFGTHCIHIGVCQFVLLDTFPELEGALDAEPDAAKVETQLLLRVITIPEPTIIVNQSLILQPSPQHCTVLFLLGHEHFVVIVLILDLYCLLRVVQQDLVLGMRIREPKQCLNT